MNALPHLMHGRPFSTDFEETTQPHPLQDEQLEMFETPPLVAIGERFASLTRVQPGKRARRILRPVY